MADHIDGPLYTERMGRSGPVMAFIHPNPMDQSCWIYQMAQMSTWFRCLSIDLPGYGRSPKAREGLVFQDIAKACWEAIDEAFPGESAILVGCSIGSSVAPHMHYLDRGRVKAMILSGTGYNPGKAFTLKRIEAYRERGIDYRWDYTFEDFSPAFRGTPIARYFADMFAERNRFGDVETLIRQFEAYRDVVEAPDHHSCIRCPTIILTGSEDGTHPSSYALKARIPGCEMRILHGAGHACQIEQPGVFNGHMLDFLGRHGLLASG
jgi:pimeloyl-ACP methyl ester carboxylesterase